VKTFFDRSGKLKRGTTREQMELGFAWACEYGHKRVMKYLLGRGIDPAAMPHGETGLHWAAHGGHAEIVKLLLRHKAPVAVRDKRFSGTPLGWALHGWCYGSKRAGKGRHHEVVEQLIEAGAQPPSVEKLDPEEIDALRKDSRMRRILGIKLADI
jgi:ankyrin repeat protein